MEKIVESFDGLFGHSIQNPEYHVANGNTKFPLPGLRPALTVK
ncbi:hypothetical protein J767_0174 [Acinetobacter baumannii 25307_4]|nr:hypothetical protein J767_0174 [Acinetobacter baumannii 25307_4]